MSQQVRGIVARRKGEPVTTETVVVPDPGPGEAVVRIQACGVCHTDLHYREGGINDEFPFLLGHEAAGIVESVGEGVSTNAHDDHVRVAPELAGRSGAGLWLHPDDLPLWRLVHPGLGPDADVVGGARPALGGYPVEGLHPPRAG